MTMAPCYKILARLITYYVVRHSLYRDGQSNNAIPYIVNKFRWTKCCHQTALSSLCSVFSLLQFTNFYL